MLIEVNWKYLLNEYPYLAIHLVNLNVPIVAISELKLTLEFV